MAASLRAFAGRIGISGPFSVLGDFYGFRQRRLPTDPMGVQVEVSLTEQITSLRGRHFNLNVIKVGSDQFTNADHNELDYSIFKVRNVYRQVGLGVGRILHWRVTTANANGLDSPTTEGDLEDLTGDWTVSNDGIDLFIPHNMAVPSNTGQYPRQVGHRRAVRQERDGDDRSSLRALGAPSRPRARSRTSWATTSACRTTTAPHAPPRPPRGTT